MRLDLTLFALGFLKALLFFLLRFNKNPTKNVIILLTANLSSDIQKNPCLETNPSIKGYNR